MSIHQPKLFEIVQQDPRYSYEAYEFVFDALKHATTLLGRRGKDPDAPEAEEGDHVSGPELLEGVRDLALREFGLMARVVFRRWGINRTDDFGEIVFNLVEAKLMSKTAEDSRRDFHAVYDLDKVLLHDYQIQLPRHLLGAELSP